MEITRIRNYASRILYTRIVKKILFTQDPEKVHDFFTEIGKKLGNSKLGKKTTRILFNYENKMLEQEILGIKFRNPIGLSAGFDKNAQLVSIMEDVGFGFVEVGSITAKSCKGNSGKRLIRFPERKSLWVNFGLNNNGAKEIASRLKGKKHKLALGISVAKTNCKETVDPETAVRDYIFTLKEFRDIGDYFTLNISCPNAYGGQPFSNPDLFERLAKEAYKMKIKKPIFVKMSPDLDKKIINKIIKISEKYKINGFICSNLTKNHHLEKGGMSGKFVEDKSEELLGYLYKKGKGKFILIGVGGIFSAEDAYRKIKKGASLVQLITGMVYNGPGLIGEINHGLVGLLKKDNYKNISEAVGKN